MASQNPQVDGDFSITDDDVMPLVCSMIGVPETVMTNVIKDIEKPHDQTITIFGKQKVKKVAKKYLPKNTSFDCLVIKILIDIEQQNEHIPSLTDYRTKLKERVRKSFTRDQIKKLLNVIGLQWVDEPTQKSVKSKKIYTEENTESRSKDVKIQEYAETLNTEYSLENIKLGEPEIEIKTEIDEEIVEESSSELEDELKSEIEIPSERELNYTENFVDDNVKVEPDQEFNEIPIKHEVCDVESSPNSHVIPTTEELTSEAEVEIKNEESMVIQTENELSGPNSAILPDFVNDINVKLEAVEEFNENCMKTEFIDVEDSLHSHVIQTTSEEHFVEELTSELENEESVVIQTENEFTDPKSAINDINIRLEEDEEFNEIPTETDFIDVEDSLQSHVILTNTEKKFVEGLTSELENKTKFTCPEKEVQQLEFVDVDATRNIEHLDQTTNNVAITDMDNCFDETEGDLPTLDYFVDKLAFQYSNYSKSSVAKWLKRLDIRFQDDHQMNTTVEHLVNDPAIPRFLKQFNLYFYFNKEANKTDDNKLEIQTDDSSDSIDPKIEEIITEIGISCHKEGVIPSLSFLLSKVQSYDINIDKDTLEDWLKRLKIVYRRSHNRRNNLGKTNKQYEQKSKIPFEYFYNHITLTRYKCSSNTLKKWLELLKINFVWNNNCDPEVKCSKKNDKLSPPVVTMLLQLEKDYNKKRQLKSRKNVKEKCTNKNINIAPTIDYFYSQINVCCKPTVKKWLDFLNIKYRLNNCDMGPECVERHLLPSSSAIKQIEELNEYFYSPKEVEDHVLEPIVKELYSHFLGKDEILTLNMIYNFILSSCAFDSNLTCSKEKLKGWLTARKIRFRDEDSTDDDNNSEKVPIFFYDSAQLPTLDYFYKNINEKRYVCSKTTLKKWLDCLTINHKSEERIIEPKLKRSELRMSSTTIIHRLVKLEEDFNKNKNLSLMLTESLTGIATEYRSRNKIPPLDVFHQHVVNSKLIRADQGYNKESLKWVLNHLNINYKTSERDDLSIPTLYYFYEKLKARGVYKLSYAQLQIWLNKENIQFEHNGKLDETLEIQNLSSDLRKLLHEIDHEFRLKNLITYLKNRDKNNTSRKRKPPTFKRLLNIIDKYELFNVDINDIYKNSVIKKWIQKLGIKFVDEEEKKPEEIIPPLEYFYEKITQIEENLCTKDTLAQWLCQIRVKFKEKDSIILKTNGVSNVPSRIINTLWELSKFYHMSDVEPIFKKIFEKFNSKNQTPSFEFLQKKIFEIKGFHITKRDLKQWLDYVGIKFQFKRCNNDQIEKEFDKKLKKKCNSGLLDTEDKFRETNTFEIKTEMSVLEEPKLNTEILEIDDSSTDSTDVLNINNSDFEKTNVFVTEADMSVLEESKLDSKTQILEIEDSMDSNNERIDLTQNTEIIEIEDDDDSSEKEQSEEHLLDIQPSSSNNQQISAVINDPLEIFESNQTTLEILQNLASKPDEFLKRLPKKRKAYSKSHYISEPDESLPNNLSAPDKVMRLLTDIEYNFYRLKKTPTLNNFYDSLVRSFGRRYSKDMLKRWLEKAGIKFKCMERQAPQLVVPQK